MPGSTELRQVFFQLTQRFRDVIETIVADGQNGRDGHDRIDVARTIATLVQSMIHGTVLRWSMSGQAFDCPVEGVRLLDLQLSRLATAPAVDGRP